jgi:HlyD family secretion protein
VANKKSRKKLYIIGGIVLVVAILAVVNLTRSSEKSTKVKTAKAKSGKIVSLVNATGKVQPRTEVKISANVSGEIVAMPVIEGQRVSKGDLLVQIDARTYEAQMRSSEAGYEAAKANLSYEQASALEAEQTYTRVKTLFEKGLASQQEYDAAIARHNTSKASFESTQARLEQAKAAVDQARESLGYTKIVAPIDGYVTNLPTEVGEIVMGSLNYQASVIMVISDLSIIEVEVEVDETDIANVELGQPVKIELDAFPDTTFAGQVSQIGNTAQVTGMGTQDQVTNFLVKILVVDTVPNIKPGMTATCDITTDERNGVINIPIGAVVLRDEELLKKNKNEKSTDEGSAGATSLAASEAADSLSDSTGTDVKKKPLEGVFLDRNGRAAFVQVVTGIADQQNIEIVSGIQPGDVVIVGPFRTLRELEDGDKIEAEDESKSNKPSES